VSVLNFLSDFSQRVNLCLQKPFERFVQGTAGKYCLLSEILLSNEVGFHFFFYPNVLVFPFLYYLIPLFGDGRLSRLIAASFSTCCQYDDEVKHTILFLNGSEYLPHLS